MRIGRLRHRVTIQTSEAVRDSYGGQTTEWVDEKTVWASIEPLRGEERFLAQQVTASTTTKIVMRYRPLSTDQRIKHGETIYDIQSVIDPEKRHEMLEVMCTEGLTNG